MQQYQDKLNEIRAKNQQRQQSIDSDSQQIDNTLNFDYRNMSVNDLIKSGSEVQSSLPNTSALSKDGQNVDFLKHIDEMDLSKITVGEQKQPEVVKININQVRWKMDPSQIGVKNKVENDEMIDSEKEQRQNEYKSIIEQKFSRKYEVGRKSETSEEY